MTDTALVTLNLDDIVTTDGTMVRADVHSLMVDKYAKMTAEGILLDPPLVYREGDRHRLADGFARMKAAERCKRNRIPCEVREGGIREARMGAILANAWHGFPWTRADKRRVVGIFLDDPEWRDWSNEEIARTAGVSPSFVGTVRRDLASQLKIGIPTTRTVRRKGTIYTMTLPVPAGDAVPLPPFDPEDPYSPHLNPDLWGLYRELEREQTLDAETKEQRRQARWRRRLEREASEREEQADSRFREVYDGLRAVTRESPEEFVAILIPSRLDILARSRLLPKTGVWMQVVQQAVDALEFGTANDERAVADASWMDAWPYGSGRALSINALATLRSAAARAIAALDAAASESPEEEEGGEEE